MSGRRRLGPRMSRHISWDCWLHNPNPEQLSGPVSLWQDRLFHNLHWPCHTNWYPLPPCVAPVFRAWFRGLDHHWYSKGLVCSALGSNVERKLESFMMWQSLGLQKIFKQNVGYALPVQSVQDAHKPLTLANVDVGLDSADKVLLLGGQTNQPHRRCPRAHTLPCNFLLIWEICASDSFPGQAAETELDLFFSASCACLITSLAVCPTQPPPIWISFDPFRRALAVGPVKNDTYEDRK